MDDVDVELDELELVAAAVGYHYYNSIMSQPARIISPKGSGFVAQVLGGPNDLCREMFRMDKHVFLKLSSVLRQRGMLRDTPGVMIDEQLAIFLNIIGHSERNRVVQGRFGHSGETISRHFNSVLKAVKSLSREFLRPPSLETPSQILESKRFYPYFEDCIGSVNCMHIPAHVPAKDQSRFRNKRGAISQSVLVACSFDHQFVFVCPGWEGSYADSHVLRAVLNDPDQNFPQVPSGKYYLVEVGCRNTDGFMAPYEGTRYGFDEYRGANHLPRNAKELFNHRHSSLSQVMQKSCKVLKERFPILKLATQYGFHTQRDIVIAACVVHNHILREDKDDWLVLKCVEGKLIEDEEEDYLCRDDQSDMQSNRSIDDDRVALSRRDSIAGNMWNDFTDKWNEW